MPLLEEEIQTFCRSYKWWTGLGMDQIHPERLGMCSDSVLFQWNYFSIAANAWALGIAD